MISQRVAELVAKKAEDGLSLEGEERLHLALHEKYREEARSYAKKGDVPLAGEKCWNSTTALVNTTIAARRVAGAP